MANITIREVDEKVFRQFKARAAEQGINLGKALTLVMRSWTTRRGNGKSFFDIRAKDLGDPFLSEKIDEVLYGSNA